MAIEDLLSRKCFQKKRTGTDNRTGLFFSENDKQNFRQANKLLM